MRQRSDEEQRINGSHGRIHLSSLPHPLPCLLHPSRPGPAPPPIFSAISFLEGRKEHNTTRPDGREEVLCFFLPHLPSLFRLVNGGSAASCCCLVTVLPVLSRRVDFSAPPLIFEIDRSQPREGSEFKSTRRRVAWICSFLCRTSKADPPSPLPFPMVLHC